MNRTYNRRIIFFLLFALIILSAMNGTSYSQTKKGTNKKDKKQITKIEKNNTILPFIGTSYGYIWESTDYEAQVYGTLAFDDTKFRISVWLMNGKTNSEDFTLLLNLSGNWYAVNEYKACGTYKQTPDKKVCWEFNNDYSSAFNNEGTVFKRVKVE